MDIFEQLGRKLSSVVLTFFIAMISGSILWAIYPHIHALFPTAAEKGIIARDISLWDAICVSWIFNILLKPTVQPMNGTKKAIEELEKK